VARRIDGTRLVCRADGHPGGCPMESGRVPDKGRMGARQRVHGCPTEGARAPDGGWVSGGGPTAGLGVGPTGDYIRAPAPHFWALSSSAQSHLQEMRVRRVHMSESAKIPKGILFEVKLEILGLDLNVSHYFEVLNVLVF
jgi:hypothetical protein